LMARRDITILVRAKVEDAKRSPSCHASQASQAFVLTSGTK
jgi:hypothetical protein